MSTFQAGDEIECITDSFSFTVGKVYKVKTVVNGRVEVDCDDFGYSSAIYEKNFTKVASGTYKLPMGTGTSWNVNGAVFNDWYGVPVEDPVRDSFTKKCECGSSKTYGENCTPDMHIDYCPLYKGNP